MITNFLAEKSGKFGPLKVAGDPINPFELRQGNPHKTFRLGISILDRLKVPYYVSAGTALGIIRDKNFIPHDNDLDVELITSYEKPINIEKIKYSFSKEGFRLVRTVFDGKFPKQLAFLSKGNIVFDLWFVYTDVEEDFVVTFSEAGKMKTPLYMVTNLKSKEWGIGGVKYNLKLPNQPEDYCEMRYGPTWKIPKTSKDPWQEDAGNLER